MPEPLIQDHLASQQGLSLFGGFVGQIEDIILDLPGALNNPGNSGNTGFTGFTKVKRKYTAEYTIKNTTAIAITIYVYADSSRSGDESPSTGKAFVIEANSTRKFKSHWTTVYRVGGNSGSPPGPDSENLMHPFFRFPAKYGTKSYPIVKQDHFIWNGVNLTKQQII